MLSVKNVSKTYKIVKKDKGLKGAIKALFLHQYDIKRAVNDISFNISDGEIVGYIGTNGAGKSTTIKMMTGILTPDSGIIDVNGIVPYRKRIDNAKNIGVVFGQRSQLSWDVSVQESFELLKHIYNISNEIYEKNLSYLSKVLDIEKLLSLPIRQMSLGQKMRCELAAAFLHNPKIVYLDEPTIGLDVDVKDRIRKFIKDINKRNGTTIILTIHDMQDIEELCERVIIIDNGNILYDGSIDKLKSYITIRHIIFELEDLSFKTKQLEMDCINKYVYEKNMLDIEYDSSNFSSKEVIERVLKVVPVKELYVKEVSIESIVQKIYRKEIVL